MGKIIEIYNNGLCFFKLRRDVYVDKYVTFTVFIKAYDFAGSHPFCMTKEDIGSTLLALKEAYDKLKGEIVLKDTESNSLINIVINDGEVFVKGEIGFCFGDNFLRFEQILDQTIIKLLHNCLSDFID